MPRKQKWCVCRKNHVNKLTCRFSVNSDCISMQTEVLTTKDEPGLKISLPLKSFLAFTVSDISAIKQRIRLASFLTQGTINYSMLYY